MEGSDSIDSVGAHDGHVCHSDFLLSAFLDKGHACYLLSVAWVSLLKLLDEQVVDEIDQFHVSWEEMLNESHRPFLKSFWKHGMVSVGESLGHDAPCLLIGHLLLVDQDSQQLDD